MSAAEPPRNAEVHGGSGRVVVVTGPPGAGKTTVARMLADRFTPSVHLHSDNFWHFIRQGAIAPYLRAAHQQNQVVIRVLAEAAFGYAAGGYAVFCDGIIGPWFLDAFREAARDSPVELHYLVLRPDEDTTLHRATSRTASDALTDPEPIRLLHTQFSDLGDLEGHVFDSSNIDAAATVEELLHGLRSNGYTLD